MECWNTPRPSQFQLPAPASVVLTVDRPVSGQWFELDGDRAVIRLSYAAATGSASARGLLQARSTSNYKTFQQTRQRWPPP